MQRERRLMKRATWLAALLFAAGFFLRTDDAGRVRSEEGISRPDSKPQSPAAAAFNPASLFQSTEESLRPPPPEKFREWAGGLAQLGENAAARRVLDRGKVKPDALSLAKDLVRRGDYETASELLEPLLRRSDDPEVALLQVACRIGLGQPDLARRPLILLEGRRDPKMKEYEKAAAFAQSLVGMAAGRRGLSLEDNPWGVKFLPDKSGSPIKPLPDGEAKKLPAEAEEILAKWLSLAPMQPTAWAVLGQILYLRGDPADSLEAFKRAKAMGYNSPIIAEYIRLLEREESARRAAVAKQLVGAAATQPEPPANGGAPVAMTESSSRAIVVFGFGGLLVGFLIGVLAAKKK